MRKLLIVFTIMLTSIVCHASPYEVDSSNIKELRMELKATDSYIAEIESYRDSIDSELRKVDALYDASHPTLSTVAIGVVTIIVVFSLGVYLLVRK